MNLKLTAPAYPVNGEITLEGSKSISNRLLIMEALSRRGDISGAVYNSKIENLSPSDDTNTLRELLALDNLINDVGAAGTTMRFLTAFFSINSGEKVLTGSERMKDRPIKILVDALRHLGADIHYLEKEGYPPIRIVGNNIKGGKLKIRSDVSSQYISALLMIGPVLEEGLILELEGKISSLPYIIMTLKTMEQFGIKYVMEKNVITVFPGKYVFDHAQSESDWSAASYYFSICALSSDSIIKIKGLFPDSLQGDSILPRLFKKLGVSSTWMDNILELKNTGIIEPDISIDFSDCPDLAQTIAVTCAALGIKAKFSGIESLKIKETDRTQALSNELEKFGVKFYAEGDHWILIGNSVQNNLPILTYEDHRMAMSFAPLSLKHSPLVIQEPDVVKKSYPSFWSDLRSLGFSTSID